MASSTSTSTDQRGGLSRRQAKAMREARRTHGDDLLESLFGQVQPHFADHPLDGDMISAVIQPQPGGGTPTPQRSAAATADAGAATSTSPPGPPSIATAVAQASAGLTIDHAMQATVSGEQPILTGLPGDDYTSVLDQVAPPPPNTY